jgi:RNA polymerase sigma-70 factor (ECF subfamily)
MHQTLSIGNHSEGSKQLICDESTHFGNLPNCISFNGESENHSMQSSKEYYSNGPETERRKAFNNIYQQYIIKMLSWANLFLESRADAQDVCSDVFLKLWENETDLSQIENIEKYLFASLKNSCLDFLRNTKNRTIKHEKLSNHLSNLSEPSIHEEIFAEFITKISREIENLPQQCKVIINLACFEGLNNHEIAQKLNIKRTVVANQKSKAIHFLRVATSLKKLAVNSIPFLYLLFHHHQ